MWTSQAGQGIPVDPQVLSLFDVVSFVSAILSLGLGILAIWLSLNFKKDSDSVNRETRELLTEIRAETKLMSQLGMKELAEYGRMSRDIVSASSTILVGKPYSHDAPADVVEDSNEPGGSEVEESNGPVD